MIATREERGRRSFAAPGVAACLALAAAPAFAIMAILSALPGGGTDMMAPTAHGVLPLNGMIPMYVLMCVFHAPPWLKLLSRR